jgi:hypothetical protein
MTKEQILAAIEQAVSTGEIKDVDTGFVTKIKEQNANAALSFWVGTSAQYNAIAEKVENCFYIITDETAEEDINKAIEQIQTNIESLESRLPKVLFKGEAKIKKDARTDISVKDIEKYKVISIDGEIYTRKKYLDENGTHFTWDMFQSNYNYFDYQTVNGTEVKVQTTFTKWFEVKAGTLTFYDGVVATDGKKYYSAFANKIAFINCDYKSTAADSIGNDWTITEIIGIA